MLNWIGTKNLRGWAARLGLASIIAAGSPIAGSLAEERAAGEHLTGSWGGLRTRLNDAGVEIGIKHIGETLATVSGGLSRGTAFQGLLDLTLETDLEKLVGWRGAKTHIRAFHIHNSRGLSAADFTGTLADPSNIGAYATARLFTAWFQQSYGTHGSFRIGQLAADDEFFASEIAGGLINGTFGWGNILASNIASGGPAYPLATPGARVQLNLTDHLSVIAGVFSGDAAGRNCYRNGPDADPQECNKHGTTFSFSGGTLWVSEAQYRVNQAEAAVGLAAAYKLGAWYHSGGFSDQRFGRDGGGNAVSLADPATTTSLIHDGSWGIYGVIDQMMWRGRDSSISFFIRGGVTPSDRNLVSWYLDGGVGIKGPSPGRKDDTLTFGIAHAYISGHAAALDRDVQALGGSPYPIRSGETALELSYAMKLTPWWIVQPDIQYIIRPGGGYPHPDDSTRRVGNVLVVGARTAISF